MKTPVRFAFVAAALATAALPGSALAQAAKPAAPAAAAATHKVGLVDMAYIFQNYAKLNDLREQMKSEYETSTTEVQGIQAQLVEVQKTLQSETLKKGSPAWNAEEQKFIELKSTMQAKATNLNREFQRKEALMYKQVHSEVTELIQKYAEYYKYTLVLRYQRDGADDADDVSKVMNKLNQFVVYHQPDDDITEKVLTVLNDRYTKAKTGK